MAIKIDWDKYKATLDDFLQTAGTGVVVWNKTTSFIDRYGEDPGSSKKYETIIMNGLIQFNFFRTWPISDVKDSGVIDNENVVVFFHKDYLNRNGWLNSDGNLDHDPALDTFIIQGVIYKDKGNTPVAQAGSDPALFLLILQREDKNN